MTDAARKIALASEASTVKMPYAILGIILLVIAVLFALVKLPSIGKTENEASSKSIFHALRHRNLSWAVAAQFFYVGAQVSVFSLFILYTTKSANLTEIKAADFLGACGFAFLIGRFLSTFLMKFILPKQLLAIYAVCNILLSMVAITATGMITVYALIGICFFMSIMFPTIFSLGIENLKGDTEYGSSLIIMSIVGGAIIPRVFGFISDATGNIQLGYFVPMVCFVVIFLFAKFGHKEVLSDKI